MLSCDTGILPVRESLTSARLPMSRLNPIAKGVNMVSPSRRTFVKLTSLAAATLTIPSAVFSQSTAPTDKPLRLGIIGAGHRGSVHIASIKSFRQFQVVAACDVRENHL